MTIISKQRGEGKTTELVLKCAEIQNSVILCVNTAQQKYIELVAKKNNVTIPHPYTVKEFLNSPPRNVESILVDEVDYVLPLMISMTYKQAHLNNQLNPEVLYGTITVNDTVSSLKEN